MNALGDVHEYDVVEARIRTRALLDEAEPMLHDLRDALTQAKNLLERLEEHRDDPAQQ